MQFISCHVKVITVTIYFYTNKKVLLRERKRYTARRLASARSATLSPDEGGWGAGVYPYPLLMGRGTPSSPNGGYPYPVLTRGYPPSIGKNGGTPCQERWGYPPTHQEGWGHSIPVRDGVPPGVWTGTQTENITFPHPF